MPTRATRLLAAVLVAAAMARRRRREPAKARRRRREPTPFALIVAGQIRMLRDPRLLENWRTSVLEPLRPAVFMSVNTQWTAAAWVTFSQADRRGPNKAGLILWAGFNARSIRLGRAIAPAPGNVAEHYKTNDIINKKRRSIKRPSHQPAPRRGATLAPQGSRSASAIARPAGAP